MITKSVLDRAKGFLCWDMFPKLTIQLIRQRNSVAYFYPPSNMFGSIIVFYNADIKDFQEPLFLLFHEAGHYMQYLEYQKKGKLREFQALIEIFQGPSRVNFEMMAWNNSKKIFGEFVHREKLNEE